MKKRLLFIFLLLAAAALACRAVPLNLAGLPRSTPTAASTLTPTLTPFPPATPSPAPSATPPAPAPLPPLDFQDQRSEETNKDSQYTFKLRYPQLDVVQANGAPVFNEAVTGLVDGLVADFKKQAPDFVNQQPDSNGSFLGLDYKVFLNQNGLVSLQFSVDTYMQGAAHPNMVTYPLTIDLQAGRRVELKDLFRPDSTYLEQISALCLADLQTRAFPVTVSGAAPTPENYRSWNLTPGALRVTFDAYQVAAYAAGPQTVEIPWQALSSQLDPGLSDRFLQP